MFDLSYLRLIPGFVHMVPRNERELRRMLLTAHAYQDGPIAMRYPRGETPAMSWKERLEPLPVGQGELLRKSSRSGLLLVAVGPQVETALAVAEALGEEDIPCAVVDARFVKPLDEPLLRTQIERARAVLTLEENVVNGGMGEGVLGLMARLDLQRPVRVLGVPDRFISFGGQGDQLAQAGLLPAQVQETARALWARVAGTTRRARKQRSA